MAASSTTLTKTITAELSPPYIEKTGERRYTETYVKAKYYTLIVTASGDSLTIDTQGAIGVTYNTSHDMTVKVPQMDSSGDFPDSTNEVVYDLTEGANSGGMFTNAGAGKNGWISGSIMPPAIRFFNGAAADATVQVFVTYPTR